MANGLPATAKDQHGRDMAKRGTCKFAVTGNSMGNDQAKAVAARPPSLAQTQIDRLRCARGARVDLALLAIS
jgi:hypothetical protein